jgi:hypothetical protein
MITIVYLLFDILFMSECDIKLTDFIGIDDIIGTKDMHHTIYLVMNHSVAHNSEIKLILFFMVEVSLYLCGIQITVLLRFTFILSFIQ